MDGESGPGGDDPGWWARALSPGYIAAGYDRCDCFEQHRVQPPGKGVHFHRDVQDMSAPGWQRLLSLIDQAADDGREVFAPLREMRVYERRQVITLPPSIARLTAVRRLDLYRSNLVRIPPEIGEMTGLEEFTPYTSHRLHWFPYELTRCRNLARSTVSTRSLYGNFKHRPPFPALQHGAIPAGQLHPRTWGATSLPTCSVCDGPFGEQNIQQMWVSLRVGADVLPLLVNACSIACVAGLPPGADGYIRDPHAGGRTAIQPAPVCP